MIFDYRTKTSYHAIGTPYSIATIFLITKGRVVSCRIVFECIAPGR